MRVLSTAVSLAEHDGFLQPAMRSMELFAGLTDEQRLKIIYFMKVLEFDAEEIVITQGDEEGGDFYVIYTGQVVAHTEGLFRGRVMGVLGPGEFFGELALLLDRPRSATVQCVEKTCCFVFSRSDLQSLMERYPAIADTIKQVARERYDKL